MFGIRELKRNARSVFKRNYVMTVVTCMLLTVALGTFNNPVKFIDRYITPLYTEQQRLQLDESLESLPILRAPDTSDIIGEFLVNVGAGNTTSKHWTQGVLSVFARATEGAGNVITGALNVVNQFAFRGTISSGIIVASGIAVAILFYIFIIQVLIVGVYRFMLENRRYTKTQLVRVLFPWTVKKGMRVAWIMLVKKIYTYLWCLTIAGGFIKHYSYMLVPVIIAENPDMKANEAITLSRKMMQGYKRKAFLMDLSFIGWMLLGYLTLSLTDIFFTNPYKYLTVIEFYSAVKEKAVENNIENVSLLHDEMLDVPLTQGVYPERKYIISPEKTRVWLSTNHNRDYSLASLVLIFFSFSMIGWIWEVIVFLFTEGQFINRGTLYGPWLPIYGFGGLIILVVLKRFHDKPGILFFVIMLIAGIMEYCTALLLETFKGMKYWDYSGYFLNIQGRVCLEGLLVFGIAGLAATYLLAPALDNMFRKIPKDVKIIICVILIAIFAADTIYSLFVPNVGLGITEYHHV